FTMQRQDGETAGFHKLQQRTGNGRERRLLIVATVESVPHPVETRQEDRRGRGGGVSGFTETALAKRVSHTSGYAQPLSRPVLIADEDSFHVSVGPDALI